MHHAIFSESKSLPPISLAAALQYKQYQDKLLQQVDNELTMRPDLLNLIGHSPIETMYRNHENHVRFMTTVFRLNSYSMLAETLIWVYRAYRNQGFSYDYFPVELAAWQHAVATRLHNQAATEINQIYEWILDHHLDFIELAAAPTNGFLAAAGSAQENAKKFLDALLTNNYQVCINLADATIHTTENLSSFYRKVITPCLYEIGRLWEDGSVSVASEHMATATAMRIMSDMYGRFVHGTSTKGKAVITAAPNELHEVGARMVADQLEFDGWHVDYLRTNLAAEEVIKFLHENKPFLLGIAAMLPYSLESTHEIIEKIKHDPALQDIKIIVGSRAFANNPDLCQKIGADFCTSDSQEAVMVAREWYLNWRQQSDE